MSLFKALIDQWNSVKVPRQHSDPAHWPPPLPEATLSHIQTHTYTRTQISRGTLKQSSSPSRLLQVLWSAGIGALILALFLDAVELNCTRFAALYSDFKDMHYLNQAFEWSTLVITDCLSYLCHSQSPQLPWINSAVIHRNISNPQQHFLHCRSSIWGQQPRFHDIHVKILHSALMCNIFINLMKYC